MLEPYGMHKHMCGVIMSQCLKRERKTDKCTAFEDHKSLTTAIKMSTESE